MNQVLVPLELNDFSLPVTVNYDNDYYEKLYLLLENYLKYIKTVPHIPTSCLDQTEENILLISKALICYKNARLDLAKEAIKKIIKPYEDDAFIVTDLNRSYAFRGMAGIQHKLTNDSYSTVFKDTYDEMNDPPLSFFKGRVEIKDLESKDMLHIPFDKRGIVSTQRFSIPGVPCMYLSTSSIGCWLELNMPREDLFQVSSYEIPLPELKVLNLCISQYLLNGTFAGYLSEEQISNSLPLIEIFPLVCATSFQVLDDNRTFKSEYIISQLVMQVANELNIQGIAYTSKKMLDLYAYPFLANLALLLPIDANEYDYPYYKHSSLINLTNPIRFSDFLKKYKDKPISKKSYCNAVYGKAEYENIDLHGDIFPYTSSSFSKFDNYLVSQNHSKFN